MRTQDYKREKHSPNGVDGNGSVTLPFSWVGDSLLAYQAKTTDLPRTTSKDAFTRYQQWEQ